MWHNLLFAMPVLSAILVCSGCDQFTLKRSTAGAIADTTPGVPQPPPAPARHRPQSASRASNASLENPALEEENFGRIRGALRRLVTAEETFFSENGSYSEDLPLMGLKPDSNITIRFLWLSREGWAVRGAHAGMSGKDCVVFVGQTQRPPRTSKYARRGREGVPVCDDSRASVPVASTSASETKPPPPADTSSALDALSPTIAMKVDLRNLAHSQETYFGTQGVYSRRTAPLALRYLWHDGVRVTILAADAQSWAAKATHERFPGKSCVIWVGSIEHRPATDGQRLQSDRSGVPICDQ
jgi:hypothetical protein